MAAANRRSAPAGPAAGAPAIRGRGCAGVARGGPRATLGACRNRSPSGLNGEVDLVACRKHSRHPLKLQPPPAIQFSMPDRVEQYVDLAVPVEKHLTGRRGRGVRNRLNRARAMGMDYRVSRDPADLTRFYEEMYLPFVSQRHGDLALVSSLEQLQAFFQQVRTLVHHPGRRGRGGQRVLCAERRLLCHRGRDPTRRCPELLHLGINAFLYWCSFEWALEKGAHTFSLGASAPAASDGAFDYKAHWGERGSSVGVA